MAHLSYFLARRFFRYDEASKGHHASTPAIRIATAGIAVGIAVMVVAVCVVSGYKTEVSNRLVGFASHLEVMDIKSLNTPERWPVVTDNSLIESVKHTPEVARADRYSLKMGIVKTEHDFAGVVLKGVGQEYDLNFMRCNVIKGTIPELRDDKSSGSVVISRILAEQLGLSVGDDVYCYFFSQVIKQRKLRVAAIYDTHMRQFDRSFVLTDIYTVNRLNGWGSDQSTGLEVRLHSMDDLPVAQFSLSHRIGGKKDRLGNAYSVVSIRENPRTASVLSWLELLDFNVMVILVIMVGIAGFTMISGLLILILERTATIGILKALGATNTRIRHTFLWLAALIVGKGLLWGNVIGLLIVALQKWLNLIPLDAEKYYVESVPVNFDILWIVGVNMASLVVTMLALLLPSLMVSRVQPAKAIQFD